MEHQFDPMRDLITDTQGMLRWSGRKPALAAATPSQANSAKDSTGTIHMGCSGGRGSFVGLPTSRAKTRLRRAIMPIAVTRAQP